MIFMPVRRDDRTGADILGGDRRQWVGPPGSRVQLSNKADLSVGRRARNMVRASPPGTTLNKAENAK